MTRTVEVARSSPESDPGMLHTDGTILSIREGSDCAKCEGAKNATMHIRASSYYGAVSVCGLCLTLEMIAFGIGEAR